MTKPGDTTNTDKYIYSGYGLRFDSTDQFSHPQGGMPRNIIIFGVDLSNSVHATNKTQNILGIQHNTRLWSNSKSKQYYNLYRKNVFT